MPPDQGAPNKICLFGYSRGTLAFSNLLGLFCPFPENFGAYDSLPFFGTENDIFNNPKTTGIKFLISRKF